MLKFLESLFSILSIPNGVYKAKGQDLYFIVEGDTMTQTDRLRSYDDVFRYSISGNTCRMMRKRVIFGGEEVQHSPIQFFSGGFYLYKVREHYDKLSEIEAAKIHN